MGPDPLSRGGHTLRDGDDRLGHPLQTARHLQHGHRPLHLLALPPLGDQAALEPVRRHVPDEAVLDRRDAARPRGVVRLRRADDPGVRLFPLHARLFLDHGLQLGDPRHRRRRLLHARPPGVPAGGLRRRADDLLPDRDDRRQGDPRRSGRDPGDARLQRGLRLVGNLFLLLAAIMLALFLYHLFALPCPASDRPVPRDPSRSASAAFLRGFVTFFRRKDIVAILAFFLLYRFAEAQLVKMVAPFLLDPRTKGGLGLIDRRGGNRLRDGRGDCADARGAARRLGHLPERVSNTGSGSWSARCTCRMRSSSSSPGRCRRASG